MLFTKRFSFTLAIFFFLVTLVLLCLPGSSFPKSNWFGILYIDKWVHITMFGLLCFLFCLPLKYTPVPNRKRSNWFWIITLLAIGYGITMEFVQKYWIPNRSFELMDIGADSVGALLARWISHKTLMNKDQSTQS